MKTQLHPTDQENIVYTVNPCALGWLLTAGTPAGVRAVWLGDSEAQLVKEFERKYSCARMNCEDGSLKEWVSTLNGYLTGDNRGRIDLPLDIPGTDFQWTVWRALQSIPYGETWTYAHLAEKIGAPQAVRAAAGACAANQAALVIPCHRVVRSDGGLGGYRWGLERKRTLLARENEQH